MLSWIEDWPDSRLLTLIPLTPSVHIFITARHSVQRISALQLLEVGVMDAQEDSDLFWKSFELVETRVSAKNK